MIRCRDLVVRFGETPALRLPSLDIADGERVGVCGPNGSGKSTLLRVLAGLIPSTSGTVEGAPKPGRAVLVHQNPYLFRGSVDENVAYALRRGGRPAGDARAWLERFGIGSLAARRARDLSGGEQRRVALARAFATRPEVLLLDEPLAGLDDEGIHALYDTLAGFEGSFVIAAPDVSGAPVNRVVTLAAP